MALAACGSLSSASAALILEGSTGTPLAFTTDINEDGVAYGTRDLTGDFFDFSVMGVFPTINLNGYISLGGANPRMDPLVLGERDAPADRIAPLWFDFGVGGSTQILEHSTNSYYGITWKDLTVPGQADLVSFQAIFFEATTTLNGKSFSAGDIAFSYGDLAFYQNVLEVVIGLEEMTGTYSGFNSSFGNMAPGWHSYGTTGDIPVSANEFVLFRPDGSGNYSVSVEAIPEPSASLLMASGIFLLLKRRRR